MKKNKLGKKCFNFGKSPTAEKKTKDRKQKQKFNIYRKKLFFFFNLISV